MNKYPPPSFISSASSLQRGKRIELKKKENSPIKE